MNCDGIVSLSDAILIARYLVGYTTFSSVKSTQADANGDGIIDVRDMITVCKLIAGILPA